MGKTWGLSWVCSGCVFAKFSKLIPVIHVGSSNYPYMHLILRLSEAEEKLMILKTGRGPGASDERQLHIHQKTSGRIEVVPFNLVQIFH